MKDRTLMTCIEVCELVKLSRTTVYTLSKQGRFPSSFKVGTRAIRWRRSEVEGWLESRPRSG